MRKKIIISREELLRLYKQEHKVSTLEAKRALLAQAASEQWDIVYYHDARTPLGRVRREQDRFVLA